MLHEYQISVPVIGGSCDANSPTNFYYQQMRFHGFKEQQMFAVV
jgi:hypothetical protein